MNVLLLDRDGVLNVEHEYICDPEQISLLPGVAAGLRRFKEWRLFVVSNQSVVGRGLCKRSDIEACNERLRALLVAEDITLADMVFCPHRPDERCPCRKPAIGMWKDLAVRHELKPEDCAMVGNRDSDMAFARAVGCMAVRVEDPLYPVIELPDIHVSDLTELADILLDAHGERIMTVDDAAAFAGRMRLAGKRIVTTNGAFDLLHDGHRFLLAEARKHGDVVIVGVNSDAVVHKSKGEGRPVEREGIRALKVARHVDRVFIFDDLDPRGWLPKIRPHVHLNAATYGKDCIEAPALREIGAELVLVPVKSDLGSTSDMVRQAHQNTL